MKHLSGLILLFSLVITTGLNCLAQEPIRILSFNIQQPYGTNWEARRDSSVKLIHIEKPDIIGTQEAVNFQRNYLFENLKTYSWYGVGRDGGDNGEGCWIFYNNRFAIDSSRSGNFWLSATPQVPSRFGGDYNRMCTYVWLTDKTSGIGFYVFNVHFPVPELNEARLTSMKFLASEIARITKNSEPVILTGDFNSPEEDAATIWMKTAADNPINLVDSYRVLHPDGFVTTGFGTRFDYIYFRKNSLFTSLSSKVITSQGGASDHFPIEADLVVNKQ